MSKENIRIFSCVCAESALFDMKLLAWSKAWGEAPCAGKLGKCKHPSAGEQELAATSLMVLCMALSFFIQGERTRESRFAISAALWPR